jgi:hypothetical protein
LPRLQILNECADLVMGLVPATLPLRPLRDGEGATCQS